MGLPASEHLGSSEEEQAEFVRNMLQAWRTHGGQIPSSTSSYSTA